MNISFGPHPETIDDVSELVLLLRNMSRDTKAMISTLQDEVYGLREIVGSLQVELIAAREQWQPPQARTRSRNGPKTRLSFTEIPRGYSAATMARQPMTPPSELFSFQQDAETVEFSPTSMTDEVIYFSPLEHHEHGVSILETECPSDIPQQRSHSRPSQPIDTTPSIHITTTPRHLTRASTGMTIEVHLAQSPLHLLPAPTPWFPSNLNNLYNYCTSPVEIESMNAIPASIFSSTTIPHKDTVPTDRLPTTTNPLHSPPRILPCTPAPHSFSFLPAQSDNEADIRDGIFIVEESTPTNPVASASVVESPMSDTTLVNSDDPDNSSNTQSSSTTSTFGRQSNQASNLSSKNPAASIPQPAAPISNVSRPTRKYLRAMSSTQTLWQHLTVVLIACLVPICLTSLGTLLQMLILAAGVEIYIMVASRRDQPDSFNEIDVRGSGKAGIDDRR